jgi:hypothetical protein
MKLKWNAKLPIQWSRVLLEKLIEPSVSEEIPRLLCNQKVHCRVHKGPPTSPLLSQANPFQFVRYKYRLKLMEPPLRWQPLYIWWLQPNPWKSVSFSFFFLPWTSVSGHFQCREMNSSGPRLNGGTRVCAIFRLILINFSHKKKLLSDWASCWNCNASNLDSRGA